MYAKSSIRSALSRGVGKGKFERVEKGVYFYDVDIKKYQMFRHAKRIYDTNKKNPNHPFDIDLELTCEGLAPVSWKIDDIEAIVNPMLLDRSLEILDEEGIFLFEEIISFNVIGSEWMLSQKTSEYNDVWNVEIKLVNNTGVHYTFAGYFFVEESVWQ